MKLEDITNIRFGINTRATATASVPCVQGKDFDKLGRLDERGLYYVDEGLVRKNDWLREGEVLLAGKGTHHYAIEWRNQLKHAVASSTFFVLQLKNGNLLSGYLAWYLNSNAAQQYFRKHEKAATVTTIGKKTLNNLNIIIPPIEVQKKVVELYKIINKENELLEDLKAQRNKLMNAVLKETIKRYV